MSAIHSPALAALLAWAHRKGLRPVADPALALARSECPLCQAGEGDPLGLWRPLRLVPREGRVVIICDGCGSEATR
jgi:hypothetical protein